MGVDGGVTVVVAEGDPMMRSIVTQALPADDFAVHQCELATELVAVAKVVRAHVAVIGPSFVRAGLDSAVPQLLAHGTRTLVVSDRAMDTIGARLLLAGASGFLLLADVSSHSLAEAVSAVAAGRTALHPEVIAEVLDQWRSSQEVGAATSELPAIELSPRERQVLAGPADGLTNRQLASRLGIAEKTIEAHKSRLYSKLGSRNQAHAVSIALDRGLI